MDQSWKKIGKIKDAHGLKGDLYVLIFSGDTSWLKQAQKVKLQRTENSGKSVNLGELVYEVERIGAFKDGLKMKLKGVEDRTQGEQLIGCEFYLPQELFVSKKGDTIYLGEILGFTVYDKENLVGTIESFSSNGPQDLLQVKSSAKALLDIPFVEAFVLQIDWPNKRLLMDLPEGLLELGDL